MPSPASADILGVIADDFTGASDIANTISRGGVPTILALNHAPATLPAGYGACVVALKSRSIPAMDAVAQSLAALDGLKRLGTAQVVFKYCSTFDSTPEGNIGPVAEALAERLGVTGAVIFCPAFPDARRTVYQGHLFVGDNLLSESGMEHHPLNPMTDPDLRRWLARQSKGAVGHLPLAVVRAGTDAIRPRLDTEAAAGRRLVIADAIDNSDLMALGRAAADAPLLTGGSGIAMGLAEARRAHVGAVTPEVRVDGRGLILAGSCSSATLGQVARYAMRNPALAVDAEAILDGSIRVEDALAFIDAHADAAPLIYSSVPPERLRAIQARRGREKTASAIEAFFASVARAAIAGGVRRLVVAGGETSGAVADGLGLAVLAVGPEIAVGVPALRALDRPLAIVLKSGNFGDDDFFTSALAALGGK